LPNGKETDGRGNRRHHSGEHEFQALVWRVIALTTSALVTPFAASVRRTPSSSHPGLHLARLLCASGCTVTSSGVDVNIKNAVDY